jgi:hypothetical protein
MEHFGLGLMNGLTDVRNEAQLITKAMYEGGDFNKQYMT